MNKFTKLLAPIISLALMHNAYAAPVSETEKKAVTAAVKKISTNVDRDVPITSIETTAVPGMLQVTSDLNIFYISQDGRYAFFGDLIDLNKDKKQWSMTEQSMRQLRAKALAAIDPSNMIIYPSTAKKKIGTITVFTDIDCPYCRKMHEHIAEYTDLGIEVRYLSFPRGGTKSTSFEEAIKVWCAKDKATAYTKAVESKEFPEKTCSTSPVASQFELGQQMGVSGTPTIFLENGAKIGGLVEPKALAKIINDEKP